MLDRSAGPRGQNLGLLIATIVVVAVGLIVFLGPVGNTVDSLAHELRTNIEREDDWQKRVALFEPPTEPELALWRSQWNALLDRVHPYESDAQLTARLARDLNMPTLRQLEVRRIWLQSDSEEEAEVTLTSPVDGTRIELGTVPIKISFVASYEDVLDLLERVETRVIPARIRTLDLKRDFPDIGVRMDVDYFFRRTG